MCSSDLRKDARNVLRAALTCAVEEELITQNYAAVPRLPGRREPRRKRQSWTVDVARRFLESARSDNDVLYPAYAAAPRVWGISPLDDQMIGGLIMWIPGGLFFYGVMTVIFFKWAARDEDTVAASQVPA